MIKIAFLNKYQGKVNRGAETYIAEVSSRLSKDFQVDVISEVNYLTLLRRKYKIIIPTNGREQVFIVRIISWLTGAKMIVSGQSGPGADDKWNLLCFPDVFIALTKPQADWAKRFNKFVKTIVIPNGVDLERFNTKNKPTKLNLSHPIILNVAALVPLKRQALIINAVSKTNASLLIVGSGPLEKELLELGNKLLPGRFQMMYLPYNKLASIYPACDLFTYPTVPWESFGIVMLEAMANNLPVVASDDPIRREIVGEAGLFVNPTDVDRYALTLNKALKMKWGTKPRKQAEKFNWDSIANEYKKLFLKIC